MDKKLRSTIAEFILGKRKSLTLEGNPQVIAVIYEAAMTSRHLMLALESTDPDRLQEALVNKRTAVERFRRFTGNSWDL